MSEVVETAKKKTVLGKRNNLYLSDEKFDSLSELGVKLGLNKGEFSLAELIDCFQSEYSYSQENVVEKQLLKEEIQRLENEIELKQLAAIETQRKLHLVHEFAQNCMLYMLTDEDAECPAPTVDEIADVYTEIQVQNLGEKPSFKDVFFAIYQRVKSRSNAG